MGIREKYSFKNKAALEKKEAWQSSKFGFYFFIPLDQWFSTLIDVNNLPFLP